MEVQVGIEAGAEAVDEDDGAEARRGDASMFQLVVMRGLAAAALLLALVVALGLARYIPRTFNLWLMALAGALLIGGNICIFLAYRIGPARSVAPFMYTLTIWAVLAGVLVFGDIPNAAAIARMALVTLAGLLIIWLDGRQRGAPSLIAQSVGL